MTSFFVDPDISKARTLATDFYTSSQYFQESKESIFAKSWQFVGDTSQVLKTGSCHPFTLLPAFLDEPLLFTKDKAGKVHCLPNVCTHRGNLLVTDDCNSAIIRCKYHGRIFDLDGKMRSMPEFKEVKDFPSTSDDLKNLPLFQLGNLLFTSLDPELDAPIFFDDIRKRIGWLPLEDFIFQPGLSKDYYVNAHWALYCENYLEGFHIPFVHADLNAVIDYGSYTTELFRYANLQLGIAKDNEECFDLPAGSPDFGKRVAAYYFWVFPNIMFNFYPWGLSLNIVQPLSLDKTKVSFYTYLWKEDKYDRGAGSGLDKVEMEDEEVVQNVQKGIRSRFYQHGRYSVTREQGTHHFHRLLAEFIG